ncbi:MAG TPA: hypothetical protein VJR58_16710 [Vineibacter sp.]|nr:hypothetical protein [Vineibacter sp.]
MISWLTRVTLALLLSGFGAAALYLVIAGPIAFFVTTISLAWPVILFVSLILGGSCYALLRRLDVSLTLPVCTATGVVVGAVSGVLLVAALNLLPYRGVDRHAENPEALRQHRDLTLPLRTAAVGALGGLIFAASGRVLRIR